MYRTTYGTSLDVVVTRLSGFAADDDCQGEEWIRGIVEVLLAAPDIWPLDDQLLEMLLAWAGVDLGHPSGLAAAVAISRYLHGTGICPVTCSHPEDNPSPLCVRVRAGENEETYEAGLSFVGTRPRDEWLRLRTRLRAAYVQVQTLTVDQDDEVDQGEEYPDAA